MATALEQERKRFDNLLSVVTSSLRALCDAMNGDILFTEALEDVAKAIAHNRFPKSWQVCYLFYKIVSTEAAYGFINRLNRDDLAFFCFDGSRN